MTGFGRSRGLVHGYPLFCEVRSLNHRFLDIQMRLPKFLDSYEGEIRKFLTKNFERGSISVRYYWGEREPAHDGLKVNRERARNYLHLLKRLKKELRLKGELDLSLFTRLDGVFFVESGTKPGGWGVAKRLLNEASMKLMDMRDKEGKAIGRQLNQGVRIIEVSLQSIEKRGALRVDEKRKRLKKRVDHIIPEGIDETRLLQEILLFAERSDIEEEVSRLKSHLKAFKESIKHSEARSQKKARSKKLLARVGRRLDFLLQEMNREANTLSSKSQDAKVSLEVIKIKEELEKVREQVQNIE
jgi:uncharacterized protein (TIGR00255 family)